VTTHSTPSFTVLPARGVVSLSGPDTREFLQGLITSDMQSVAPSKTRYAALLTPQGKFLFDFFVCERDSTFLLECERSRAADLLKRLTLYKLRAKVELADVSADYAVCALFAEDLSQGRFEGIQQPGDTIPFQDGLCFADPRHPRLGYRFILPADRLDAATTALGMTPGYPDRYDAFRIELGIPEGGRDIVPDKSFILESNFDELHGVDHKKGCYIGQEVTSRTKRKASLRKRILPVRVFGEMPGPGTPIEAGGAEVGTLLSAQGNAALALIRLDRAQKALENEADLIAAGSAVAIEPPDWIDVSDWRLDRQGPDQAG